MSSTLSETQSKLKQVERENETLLSTLAHEKKASILLKGESEDIENQLKEETKQLRNARKSLKQLQDMYDRIVMESQSEHTQFEERLKRAQTLSNFTEHVQSDYELKLAKLNQKLYDTESSHQEVTSDLNTKIKHVEAKYATLQYEYNQEKTEVCNVMSII